MIYGDLFADLREIRPKVFYFDLLVQYVGVEELIFRNIWSL